MKIKNTLLAAAFSAGLFSATSAHAVLTLTLGGQGVYDSDRDITWLQNANLAATNTFGVSGINANGTMTWNTAQSWIAGMNAANYLGYNDWRLPITMQPDASCSGYSIVESYGYNCTGSEMGHLYHTDLGNLGTYNTSWAYQPGWGLTNTGPFSNVQSDYYWSGTEYALNTGAAWFFHTRGGRQDALGKGEDYIYAWVVRDGDSPVVTSPVPEPETYTMLLTGLGLLSFTARRRKQSA